tara:strand:- start:1217 stop:1594 length:378 start_codon:yes stop_codon:yes gene_type:complete
MEFPTELKYTKDHEWIRIEGKTATIGITAYALEQLGEVVHLELPENGEEFSLGDSFGTVESIKTVSDLYMPVNGKVTQVNNEIVEDLEKLPEDPYKNGWLVKVSFESNPEEIMTSAEYQKFIEEE